MSHYVLDASGLLCPLPVIRTQERCQELRPGDTMEVRSSDPGALNDIPAWCRVHGHRVVEALERDGRYIVTLELGVG